ncbi:MAG: 50S ribosomal protein L6 [Candidatus Peribacteraceae bacterium]|nr:50S ribosomal protein L6 [Candidatus Peribacteraceae bacterium]
MSRIGRKAVAIPSGITVTVAGGAVQVKGPKGELKFGVLPEVSVTVQDGTVTVERKGDSRDASARQGLTRQMVTNMIIGVHQGFLKKLEVIGVGYKVQVQGKKLILNLGYSHPVEYTLPEGITVTQDEKNKNLLTVQGIDKQLVGQVAADLRSLRPPEPYTGKGIRYSDEYVRRKPGKAAVGKGGAAGA